MLIAVGDIHDECHFALHCSYTVAIFSLFCFLNIIFLNEASIYKWYKDVFPRAFLVCINTVGGFAMIKFKCGVMETIRCVGKLLPSWFILIISAFVQISCSLWISHQMYYFCFCAVVSGYLSSFFVKCVKKMVRRLYMQ